MFRRLRTKAIVVAKKNVSENVQKHFSVSQNKKSFWKQSGFRTNGGTDSEREYFLNRQAEFLSLPTFPKSNACD